MRRPLIPPSVGRGALLLVIAITSSVFARPATRLDDRTPSGQIGFFGDIGKLVYRRSSYLVRPTTLLLTEDGSFALLHLRWIGWGTDVARATGVWSASDCTPSCASGKRTTGAAGISLSRPGWVLGRRAYRCFQVTLIARHGNRARTCLRRHGNFYFYAMTAEPAVSPARRAEGPRHARTLCAASPASRRTRMSGGCCT